MRGRCGRHRFGARRFAPDARTGTRGRFRPGRSSTSVIVPRPAAGEAGPRSRSTTTSSCSTIPVQANVALQRGTARAALTTDATQRACAPAAAQSRRRSRPAESPHRMRARPKRSVSVRARPVALPRRGSSRRFGSTASSKLSSTGMPGMSGIADAPRRDVEDVGFSGQRAQLGAQPHGDGVLVDDAQPARLGQRGEDRLAVERAAACANRPLRHRSLRRRASRRRPATRAASSRTRAPLRRGLRARSTRDRSAPRSRLQARDRGSRDRCACARARAPGRGPRIAANSKPFASAGVDGATTLSPGACA